MWGLPCCFIACYAIVGAGRIDARLSEIGRERLHCAHDSGEHILWLCSSAKGEGRVAWSSRPVPVEIVSCRHRLDRETAVNTAFRRALAEQLQFAEQE